MNRKTANFTVNPIYQDDVKLEERGVVGFSFGGDLKEREVSDLKPQRRSIKEFTEEISNGYIG